MKKSLLLGLSMVLLASNVRADDAVHSDALLSDEKGKGNLRLNFRRVALDVTSTEVKNADRYQDSPVAELSADSETVINGIFDGVLEYEQVNYQWNNALYMAYGKKTIKQTDGTKIKNESADEILLSTDYARKMWKYNGADVGPFGNLGYQTEFTNNDASPKMKILRAKTGMKLWNGEYIKELYAAVVGEHDMTYNRDVDKAAWEIGGRAEYVLREGVKFQLDGYFRDYFSYSEYIGTDLKYDLNVNARMDVKLVGAFSLAPFVSYRLAESREAGVEGSNFTLGLSLTYSEIFDIWKD